MPNFSAVCFISYITVFAMLQTVFFSVFLLFLCVTNGNVIIISNGPISGEEYDNFFAYRGLRYADRSINELRLAPPKPYVETWNDTKQFRNYGSPCSTYTHIGYVYQINEDCLFLNVFVPKLVLELQEKVSAIFTIHGGCFMFGYRKI